MPERASLKRSSAPTTLKISLYASGALCAVILVCVAVLLLFPDTFINGYFKNRIMKEFTKSHPAISLRISGLHYTTLKNCIVFYGITLISNDSAFSCSVGRFSVSGVSWIRIFRHEDIASRAINGSVADAREIALIFGRRQYELRCGRLRVSLPDSEISVDDLELHPLVTDDHLFSSSKYRQTRFRINIPHCKVSGADCRGLLQGKIYRADSIKVNDPFFDILVDMDTPYNRNVSRPLMPCEALSLISKVIRVNSLNILNGRLKYAERYTVGSPPAEVTFDSMRLSAEGITNHAPRGALAVIQGTGVFMKTSTMKIHMLIPVISPAIPIRYFGTLDAMNLARLNSFLEIGEGLRIKSGTLQNAAFDINIVAGNASGSLRAMYKNLYVAAIKKGTGSNKDASNRIASFMINALKIRGANVPDKSGSIKIGVVKYTRKQDDTFLQLVWFSLRSGIGDVVGF